MPIEEVEHVVGYPNVIKPFSMAGIDLPNRVFIPAHTTNFAAFPQAAGSELNKYQRHIDYYEPRARSGVSLIITEAIKTYAPTASRRKIHAIDDAAIDDLTAIAESVRGAGTALFAQLNEAGRHVGGSRQVEKSSAVGASPIPWSAGGIPPHQLLPPEIRDICASFGAGAARLERAGFQGVELHLGHGHLLAQFLSPVSNHRRDAYGATADGRLRIVREALDSIVRQSNLPVGVRVSASEFVDGGLDVDDVVHVLQKLLAEFDLAFIDVSQSSYIGGYSLATQIADMTFASAPFVPLTKHIASEFRSTPMLTACRIDDLEVAERVLADTDYDMVGMVRAHIADPELVSKSLARLDSDTRVPVRRCIACNQGCAGRLEAGLAIGCVVNPRVGFEREWKILDDQQRDIAGPRPKVLVIGGGPAGLKAGIAAANVGGSVSVIERRAQFGGQLIAASMLPGRERFGVLIEDLLEESSAVGVRLIASTSFSPEFLAAHGPFDKILVATGADLPDPGYSAAVAVPLFRSWQEGSDAGDLGDHVLVVDETGGWEAYGIAEAVAHVGARVTLVFDDGSPASGVTLYSRGALLARLRELRVDLKANARLQSVTSDGNARLESALSGSNFSVGGVSAVVSVGHRVATGNSIAEQCFRLAPEAEVTLIGDAFQPRTVLDAMEEAEVAGHATGGLSSGHYGPVGVVRTSLAKTQLDLEESLPDP